VVPDAYREFMLCLKNLFRGENPVLVAAEIGQPSFGVPYHEHPRIDASVFDEKVLYCRDTLRVKKGAHPYSMSIGEKPRDDRSDNNTNEITKDQRCEPLETS
jgi:hypothetical protein